MQGFQLELTFYFVIEPRWAFVTACDCFMRNKFTENVENGVIENNYFLIDTYYLTL